MNANKLNSIHEFLMIRRMNKKGHLTHFAVAQHNNFHESNFDYPLRRIKATIFVFE